MEMENLLILVPENFIGDVKNSKIKIEIFRFKLHCDVSYVQNEMKHHWQMPDLSV